MGSLIRPRYLARALILCVLGVASVCGALETDQYYAWTQPLADSTAALNAKLNLELELAIEHVAARNGEELPQCTDIAERLMKQLHFTTFQDFELWTLNTTLIDRYPANPEQELEYRQSNLYHRHGVLDVSTWLPNVPTIEVNGIRLGTDKLAHFVSSGWRWHREYVKELERGLSHEEAERQILDSGLYWERSLMGSLATGVFSPGDLEANYRGMEYYYSLCHGEEPVLESSAAGWEIRRPFDFSTVIGPEWDESYNTPIYSKRRWRKVRPVLVGYCEELNHPAVQERRDYYRSIERTTRIGEELDRMISEDIVPDPYQFSIEANCAGASVARERISRTTGNLGLPENGPPDPQLIEEIRAIDSNLERRPVGTLGLNFSYPDRLGGSVGVLWARLPAHYDCMTLCPFEGPFLQLQGGWNAVRLSGGWARIIGEKKNNRFFVSDVYVGLGFKASLLHTYGDPPSEEAGRTFAGGEFEFTIVQINFRGGIYHRIAGPKPDDPWLLTLTVGWGF
ncbi:MAG: hypothetical protein GY906_37690 [bacterium]|nr:hypothetical protein [bacterium]